MKNIWYRLISLLLVIVLTVNMLPLGVLAEEYQEAVAEAGLVTKTFEDADGNTYDFGYGLNWSGVIKDWRTDKYAPKKR